MKLKYGKVVITKNGWHWKKGIGDTIVATEPQYPARARVKGNKYIRHSVKYITKS